MSPSFPPSPGPTPHRPWPRLAGLLAGLVLAATAYATPPDTPTPPWGAPLRVPMAQALEAAWARSVASAELAGQQQRAQAGQAMAASWFSAAPALAAAHRRDTGHAAQSAREIELGMSWPLWWPGQRERSRQTANAEARLAEAYQRLARWHLAGQLRDTAAQLQAAELAWRQAHQQRQMLHTLATDVARRVQAGDLAPADNLAAQAEVLAAQAQQAAAEHQVQVQQAAWQLLTGLDAWPDNEGLTGDTPSPQTSPHPATEEAEIQLSLTQHRLALIQAQRGGPPELGVSLSQERTGSGPARDNRVTLALRVPLNTGPHNQVPLASALSAQAMALANLQQIQRQTSADLARAHQAERSALAQYEAEQARAGLLRQRAQWLQKSFDAGETALPDLLRALASAFQADAAAAHQQAALAQARVRLHHTRGQLP